MNSVEKRAQKEQAMNFKRAMAMIRKMREQEIPFAHITKALNKEKLTTVTGRKWTQFNVQACFYNHN